MSAKINPLVAVRSHFSLGESLMQPADIKAAAVRVEEPRVIVCDSMTVSALIQTSKLADDSFQPRFGVALQVFDDLSIRDKQTKQTTCWLKVYPHEWEAMQSVFRTLTKAYDDAHFFNGPRLGWDDVSKLLQTGNFSVSTGDLNGLLEHPRAAYYIQMLAAHVGQDNFFVELVPIPSGYHDRMNAVALGFINDGYQPLLTIPVLYEGNRHDMFVTNLAIAKRSTKTRPFTMRQPVFKEYMAKTHGEAEDLIRTARESLVRMGISAGTAHWQKAIDNQTKLYDSLSYKWEKQPIALPQLAADPDRRVKELCVEGMKKRMAIPVFGHKIDQAEMRATYLPRLKYELNVLKDMGFAPYFLLVDDLVRWCKTNGIAVGPGRGSVGGSLVAYLMGITDIDPIRFGLIFERFINPSRKDLPDIDLDFMSSRRQEVVDYLVGRHGADRVAGISNYGALGSASAMKDVGRVFGLDVTKISASKFVPKEHGQPVDLETARSAVAEISRFADDHPAVWKHAVGLQNIMRNYGRHAAGTIVSGVPIVERAVIERRAGAPTINWDMRVAEDMGLVKLDILGLSTLDTMSRCLDFIKRQHKPVPDLLTIPLDDVETLKNFGEGNTLGVFQMEGGAARRILKDMSEVNPLSFDDIVAVNALNRPGPIDAGLVDKYVKAKNGYATNDLPHPNMEAALKETFNVIVYQEQVMKVAVDLCGFSLADADGLRKAMGKKDKKLMAKMKDQFIKGAWDHSSFDNARAAELFEEIEVFAGYAFNKSHAAEYSLISYQCMWLKTHYPIEFYAASMSTVGEDKLKAILLDALKVGIEVIPPNINTSENDFVIANANTLIAPFNRVKNVTDKSGMAIMAVRHEGKIKGIEDLRERLTEKKWGRYCNVKVIDSLNAVGAFAYVEPGQVAPTDDSRIKDQLLLMPALVTRAMKSDRLIPMDKYTAARLTAIVADYDAVDPAAVHARPRCPSKAKFMVVSDCPSWSEEADKKFTSGKSFDFTNEALIKAGLRAKDAYWTGLLKRPKEDKLISPDEIKLYAPFLDREVELLKPQLIVTLGSAAARHFIPDLKGSILDQVGRVVYLKKIEATLIIGFNPAMIYHDRSKLDDLVNVFSAAREIIAPLL